MSEQPNDAKQPTHPEKVGGGEVAGVTSAELEQVEVLDARLSAAAPHVTELRPEAREELDSMAVAARTDRRRANFRRPMGRMAVIGIAAAVALGGGAAAVANGLGDLPLWIQNPRGQFEITYPDGTQCQVRVGGISARSIEQRDHLRELVASGQLEEEIDVAAAVEWRLEELDIEMPPPKSRERASLYSISTTEAIADVFGEDLNDHGYEPRGLGFNAYTECPEHDWMTPSEPEK